MIKILLGGSPCTYWSIAQKQNRETQAEGLGWELFKNYLIAKEKFKPDLFLYENNVSAAQPIKDQIKQELKVDQTDARYIEINSALVSAQSRKRFYVHNCGAVEQPTDREIYLCDILENGILINTAASGKAQCIRATIYKDGIRNMVANTVDRRTCVAKPVRTGTMPQLNGLLKDNQETRIYDINGKGVTLSANGGGWGAKTGLYAMPINPLKSGKTRTLTAGCSNKGVKHIIESDFSDNPHKQQWDCIAQPVYDFDGEKYSIYKVENGLIEIKGKNYPIKLEDGFYIIRKLTITECCRLQTLPDNYCRAVSKSQAYKGLGNGWTAEVIIHILSNALKNISKDEKLLVLSMYDGIGTGRYCLNKLGFNNVEYHAYEIDKYAMQVANSNFSDIIQRGDAFALREGGWKL